MTTREADKIIKAARPITVRNDRFNETFTKVFVSRDHYTITSEDGGRWERDELEVISNI